MFRVGVRCRAIVSAILC